MSTASVTAATPATSTRQGSVRWALARVEGRRLVCHPLFLLGVACSAVVLAINADDSADEYWNLMGALRPVPRDSDAGTNSHHGGAAIARYQRGNPRDDTITLLP